MQSDTIQEEQRLFNQIADGCEIAFSTVFHKYNRCLFSVILKITKSEPEAEEIIQNVFLKLWLNRSMLPEIEKPAAWLYKVASNLALSYLRSKAVQLRHEKKLSWHQPVAQDEIQLELEAKELQIFISQAVENLPPGRREIYKLSRQQGLNRLEIARQLGITESTVKNQLGSALKFIHQYISQKQGIHLPAIFFILI